MGTTCIDHRRDKVWIIRFDINFYVLFLYCELIKYLPTNVLCCLVAVVVVVVVSVLRAVCVLFVFSWYLIVEVCIFLEVITDV